MAPAPLIFDQFHLFRAQAMQISLIFTNRASIFMSIRGKNLPRRAAPHHRLRTGMLFNTPGLYCSNENRTYTLDRLAKRARRCTITVSREIRSV